MEFTVYADRQAKQTHNFWNHIHFHPTDAIEDDWGQRILNRVAKDKVAKTVRMYTMMEDIVTVSADGRLQYDFTLTDIRLDYMISQGFEILLSYNFIPPCIATDPVESSAHAKNKTRYKGKMIVTSPPKDYTLWEEICREYTKHIVERYGVERVKYWYLQCFNEPDLGSFFFRSQENQKIRAAEYHKLYTGFENGILSVSSELRIGGPALAGNFVFMEEFLRLIRENGNRMDYICVHTYGADPNQIESGEHPLNVRNSLEKIYKLKQLAADYGFGHLPFVIDEWGGASRGFCNMEQVPCLEFRESEVFSAYYARMISLYDDLELGIDRMMICLSGQHEMETDFTGFRGFFTLNFFAKPIYNAYKLAAKLGSKKLSCSCSYISSDFSIFPTVSDNGRISILLAHCTDTLDELEPEQIRLNLEGLQGAYTVCLWVIDDENANAYAEFKRMDTPEDLSPEQITYLREKAECIPRIYEMGEAGESIEFTARSNSVTLVEIIPV